MHQITKEYDAILFDMDGTLIDSTAGVQGAWRIFATQYPGLDVPYILDHVHGVRTTESLRRFCGIEDPATLESEAARFEQAVLDTPKEDGSPGTVSLPSVGRIMSALLAHEDTSTNPLWAICTSATRHYATTALGQAGIRLPKILTTAEDVTQGKPSPVPYIQCAQKLGITDEAGRSRCLVMEDAPSGIRSGLAAGCDVLAVCTSHDNAQLEPIKPTYLVKNLDSVQVSVNDAGKVVVVVTTDK